MKKRMLIAALLACALNASAGSLVVQTTALQDVALAKIVEAENAARAARLAEINAQRAQRLADLNKMRDAQLPRLTAQDADLAELTAVHAGFEPVDAPRMLLLLASRNMTAELAAAEKALADAKSAAAVAAVEAIAKKAPDCRDKATAAGLDPDVCGE
mgnify:FL=1